MTVNYLTQHGEKVKDLYNVQHGICTLRDKTFISSDVKSTDDPELVLFNGSKIEKDILSKYQLIKELIQ